MVSFGVVVFPGSNCDQDTYWVIKEVLGCPVRYIWHTETKIDVQCVILPGGFSYGDYLRAGSIVAFSPVMDAVCEFAEGGGLVLGICNGFQILVEKKLLPGFLLKNVKLKFVCKMARLKVENTNTPFTCAAGEGQVLRMPVAHGYGNFYATQDVLRGIEERKLVTLRYIDNPNGSLNDIAGISEGTVMGMMPHPERASEIVLGSDDGLVIFKSILKWLS